MYRALFTFSAVFAGLLGLLLLFFPGVYLSLYAVTYSPEMDFAAQRFAPVIIGLGGLLWAGRDLPQGPFAANFAGIAAMVFAAVAATGLFHFQTGSAGVSILVAAATEIVLAALFAIVSRQIRNA